MNAPLINVRLIAVAASSFLLFAATENACAQTPLRWKLEKGQKFELQMEQQTVSLVTLSSKKLNSSVDLKVFVTWDVQQAESDSFVIEQTVDAIRIEMKGPGVNAVTYDSREKKPIVGAAKELASGVAPLIGAKFKVTMNSLGAIAATEKLPEVAPALAPAEGVKPAVSNETIALLLREPLLPLPKELAGNEPTWTDERETTTALGQVKQKRTFMLAGNEDRGGVLAAKITLKGDLEVTPAAGKKGAAKLTTQAHTGTIWFAKEAGRLVAAESTQRLVTESAYRDSAIVVDLTTTLSTKLSPRE